MFLDFLWKRNTADDEPIDYDVDQAVIIDIDFQGIDDFGTQDQRQQVEELEASLSELLPDRSIIDGDEFGDGTCTIYIYGSSADEIFKSIEATLKKSAFSRIDITLQYGKPEDIDTIDKKFTLIG